MQSKSLITNGSALIMLAFLTSMPLLGKSQSKSLFRTAVYINGKDTLPYRILMPENYNPAIKYPLFFMLHGVYETGKDNAAQLKNGSSLFLNEKNRKDFPAIIVFPQCPDDSYWSNVKISRDSMANKYVFDFQTGGEPTKAVSTLLGLIDQLLEQPYIDKSRVYIGGLSMGGMGVFEMLRRRPHTFAAAVAICGGDNPVNAKVYAKNTALWIFHGAKDDIVSPDYSKNMVDALKAAGGKPKFTLYANDGHNCWDDAFAEPDFLSWIFSHQK